MYLFRQFWAFRWLADFFQKSIVSRASVNLFFEKGPPFAQSFSTEVAIESGLYIQPWDQKIELRTRFWHIWQIWHFLAVPSQVRRSGQICGSGSEAVRSCPEHFLARSAGLARKCQKVLRTAILARIVSGALSGQNRQNRDFSRKVEISAILQISGSDTILDMWIQGAVWWAQMPELVCTLLSETASDIMCTACWWHAWHMYTCTSCQRHTRTCIHHAHSLACFAHSCALKIIFGISSRYEMLFRACSWCEWRICSMSPSFLPHLTSEHIAPMIMNNDVVIVHSLWVRDTFRLRHTLCTQMIISMLVKKQTSEWDDVSEHRNAIV